MVRVSGLAALRADSRVEIVDDERGMGGNIIVTMQPGWTIDPLDEHAGVFGADTLSEAWKTLRSAVRFTPPQGSPSPVVGVRDVGKGALVAAGASPSGTGLSPSVEPVPVSPPDGASIPSAFAEAVAARFHEAYERLAPFFGYQTREASAVPWSAVPENNRKLMAAVCAEIMAPVYPFVQRAECLRIVADLPDKVKVELSGKVPRRDEWFDTTPLTLGDFRALASAMSARSAETEGLSPQDASAIGAAETPKPHQPSESDHG